MTAASTADRAASATSIPLSELGEAGQQGPDVDPPMRARVEHACSGPSSNDMGGTHGACSYRAGTGEGASGIEEHSPTCMRRLVSAWKRLAASAPKT